MVLLVDLDNTIVDWDGEIVSRWNPVWGPMSFVGRPTYYAQGSAKHHIREVIHQPGFYETAPPYPGAVESLLELANHVPVMILSTPMDTSPASYSEKAKWVQRHLGSDWVRRMTLAHDKTAHKGKILVDDKPDIHGIFKPEWFQVFYDQSYNRGLPGPRIWRWNQDTVKYLLDLMR